MHCGTGTRDAMRLLAKREELVLIEQAEDSCPDVGDEDEAPTKSMF